MTFANSGSLSVKDLNSEESDLETRAKKLLLEINQNREFRHQLGEDTKRHYEEFRFLVNKRYIVKTGETSKFIDYKVTREGEKYALN